MRESRTHTHGDMSSGHHDRHHGTTGREQRHTSGRTHTESANEPRINTQSDEHRRGGGESDWTEPNRRPDYGTRPRH
jgi:hypothetical protein